MKLPSEIPQLAEPADIPDPELLTIHLDGAGSLTISQQRGVIVDEAGNQEFFWFRLTLPFRLEAPLPLENFDALKPALREQLAAGAGQLILNMLADHELRTTAAISINEPPLPAMEPDHTELF